MNSRLGALVSIVVGLGIVVLVQCTPPVINNLMMEAVGKEFKRDESKGKHPPTDGNYGVVMSFKPIGVASRGQAEISQSLLPVKSIQEYFLHQIERNKERETVRRKLRKRKSSIFDPLLLPPEPAVGRSKISPNKPSNSSEKFHIEAQKGYIEKQPDAKASKKQLEMPAVESFPAAVHEAHESWLLTAVIVMGCLSIVSTVGTVVNAYYAFRRPADATSYRLNP